MYKTQTQIKLGGARREAKESSSHSTPHHHSRPGSSGEKFTLNIFSGVKVNDPVQDDLTYRRSARLIVTMDIIFSTFLLVAYLISLVSGSAHQSSTKHDEGSRTYEDASSSSSSGSGGGSSSSSSSLRNKESSLLGPSESSSPTSSLTKKQRETLAVLVWMGLFAVCILQLLVAGGTLGGTYERDGRKTIRNCKIWMVSTCLLVVLLVIQLVAVLVFGHFKSDYIGIILLIAEIAFRSTGLVILSRFIKELTLEFCGEDDTDMGDRIFYEKLCPSPNTTAVVVETHRV